MHTIVYVMLYIKYCWLQLQCCISNVVHELLCMQRCTCNIVQMYMQCCTCTIVHASLYMQYCTCNVVHAILYMQCFTCYVVWWTIFYGYWNWNSCNFRYNQNITIVFTISTRTRLNNIYSHLLGPLHINCMCSVHTQTHTKAQTKITNWLIKL